MSLQSTIRTISLTHSLHGIHFMNNRLSFLLLNQLLTTAICSSRTWLIGSYLLVGFSTSVLAEQTTVQTTVQGATSSDSQSIQLPTYEFYLTNKAENNMPSREKMTAFDCSDRVHLVMEAFNLEPGNHRLEVLWFNPQGKRQEVTRFNFNGAAYSRVWAWLQLHGSTGAAIGQIFDPSFGMEDFIGNWTAKVSINQTPIESVEFHVIC